MLQMDTDEERLVAVLHAVVEDSPDWSLDASSVAIAGAMGVRPEQCVSRVSADR
jgi:hypothetical protein